MAIEPLPDEETEYIPSIDDEMDGEVDAAPGDEVADTTPGVFEPDSDPVDEEGVESDPEEQDGFEPTDSSAEQSLPVEPLFADEFPGYIPLEGDPATAEVDDDEGDVYSASTGAPTDEEWDAVEDGDAPAPVAMMLASDVIPDDSLDPGSLTGADFTVENVASDAMVDPDVAAPVSYEIQGKPPEGEWQTLATVPADQVDAEVAGLPTEQAWLFRVRAQFSNGEVTDWSAETSVDLPRDMLAPPVPSTPAVTAKRGVFTIKWDGKGVGGKAQPADYKFTIVWVSTSGDAGTWNAIGTMNEAGELLWTGGEYYANMYFSLSSLDNYGNSSARSGSAVSVMKPLVEEPDIQSKLDEMDAKTDGAITEAQELGNRLGTAESELADSKQRLTAAEADLDNAFGLIGSADSKATNAQAKADEAKADAATAAGIANGKGDVLIQSTTPVTAMRKATTLWIDTTGGANTPKRWNGTAWAEVTDKAAKDAASAAASADAKAQQAIKDAAEAKAQAESAIRQAPTLFEWTADFNPGNNTTQTKTPTEISYDGNQAASQYAHRFTSKSTPITGNRVYRIQAIVSNLGTASARLQTGFYLNNANGGYVSSLWPSDSYSPIPAGASRVAVYSTPRLGDLPTGVAMASAATYFLDSQPMVVHDMKVVDVTDIISAQETADSALTMAGTKNTVYYDTKNPTGTGNKGDIWRKTDANKNVIAEWFWGAANKWESSQVTTDMISNLDVGKLTAGAATIDSAVVNKIAAETASIQEADIKNLFVSNGTFSEAVIDKLWADVIHARKITADMMAIGSFDNLVPDPSFEDGGKGWRDDGASSFNFMNGADGARTGKWWLKLTLSTTGLTHAHYHDTMIPVGAGETFKCGLHWKVLSGDGYARVRMYEYGATNNYLRSTLAGASSEIISDGWNRSSVSFTPREDARFIRLRVAPYANVENTVFAVDDVYCNRMSGGELIVDGAITTEKLDANAVTAGKVAANAITADKISSGAVTATKIDSGAVTADKIKAGAITADKLDAGAITGKTITGGTINGAKVVGGQFQTDADENKGVLIRSNLGVVSRNSDGSSAALYDGLINCKGSGGGELSLMANPSVVSIGIKTKGQSGSGGLFAMGSSLTIDPPQSSGHAQPKLVLTSDTYTNGGATLGIHAETINLSPRGDAVVSRPITIRAGILGATDDVKVQAKRLELNGGDFLKQGQILLNNDSSAYVLSETIYLRTYSSAANMYITANGVLGRSTSALKYKTDVQAVDTSSYEDALLGIEHKSWVDKTEAKGYEDYLAWEAEHPLQPIPQEMLETPTAPPKRHYGAIADEFHEAGLSQFVTYDQNGEVEGLAYDRVGVALLPIVRKQRDKIADLEAKLEALMERVDRLEAA